MISFDYRRSAPPSFIRRIVELRVPEHYQSVLIALGMSAIAVFGAWLIESRRLHQTLEMQSIYQQRFDAAQRALRHAKVYEARIRQLMALDSRLNTIRSSGGADARQLAEIANRLPERAWLTGIAYEGDALAIEGRATDLNALSAVIRNLTNASTMRSPSLVSATAVTDTNRRPTIKYTLRLEDRR